MRICRTIGVLLALSTMALGQAAAQSTGAAPTLIRLDVQFLTAEGQPRTGPALVVISLYERQSDPAPRWVEYQQVTLDRLGRSVLQFGATRAEGLPADLFTGDAATHWVGVSIENEAEQPRVMLVSVPYAAKAASAETLAGKSASDFVLSSTFRDDLRTVLEEEGVGTGSDVGANAIVGSLNVLQKGDGAAGTIDSALWEASGNLGVGTTAPTGTLEVQGTTNASLHIDATNGIPMLRFQAAGSDRWGFLADHAGLGSLGLFDYHGASTGYRMLLDSSGNVGIGTTAPTARLEVEGENPAIHVDATSGIPVLRFQVGGADRWGLLAEHAGAGALGLYDYNGASTGYRMVFDTNGNVGIGTTSPGAKLHVAGDVIVDGNIGAKYQDVAEWVDAAESLDAGSLVTIDVTATNRVTAARKAYDVRVAGAVSRQPGLILGEGGEGKVLVAQSGRVKVKADAKFGAIKPGDLLVSSPTPGHVMRSTPVKVGGAQLHRPGTVVGKALEALGTGTGEILVLLTLQ